jgi:hypothetical protein
MAFGIRQHPGNVDSAAAFGYRRPSFEELRNFAGVSSDFGFQRFAAARRGSGMSPVPGRSGI